MDDRLQRGSAARAVVTAGLDLPGKWIRNHMRATVHRVRGMWLGRTVVYVGGPHPMMHAVAMIAGRRGVDCQVCLEQAMACGMGTCQSCVVRIEDHDKPSEGAAQGQPWRYRLACTDGPIFSAADVVW